MPITYLLLDTPLPLLVFLFVCVIFKLSSALWLLFVQLICVAVVFFGSSVLLVCYCAGCFTNYRCGCGFEPDTCFVILCVLLGHICGTNSVI